MGRAIIAACVFAPSARAEEPTPGEPPAVTAAGREPASRVVPENERPLGGPGGSPPGARARTNEAAGPSPPLGALRTALSLGAVLALAGACAWGLKRLSARSGSLLGAAGPGGRAPSGILEVLGRYPLARGTTLILLRADRRVLLIGQSSGAVRGGAALSTLCEFTSPEEVASLMSKARDASGESIAGQFSTALKSADRTIRAAADRAGLGAPARQPAAGPNGAARRREVVSSAGDRAELWDIPARGRDRAPGSGPPVVAPVTRSAEAPRPDAPEDGLGEEALDAAAETLRRRLIALRAVGDDQGGSP